MSFRFAALLAVALACACVRAGRRSRARREPAHRRDQEGGRAARRRARQRAVAGREHHGLAARPWSGPAWLLAKEYAKRLDVKLEAVPVSHETKVPVLASNQVDISVTPLAETPDRLKVVDFVIYSSTSVCMFGLAANPKFADAKTRRRPQQARHHHRLLHRRRRGRLGEGALPQGARCAASPARAWRRSRK